MVAVPLSCSMCGTVLDIGAASACDSCPLSNRCALTCCPACGFSLIDVGRSRLGGLALRLARAIRMALQTSAISGPSTTLAEARAGASVEVDRIDGLPLWQAQQLTAYGVAPGRRLDVVQTSPLVIVRVDYVEVAFERSLAHGVHLA